MEPLEKKHRECFWGTDGESMEDAYDEFNDLFKESIEILHCIDMNEDKRHNILYGHSFGQIK